MICGILSFWYQGSMEFWSKRENKNGMVDILVSPLGKTYAFSQSICRCPKAQNLILLKKKKIKSCFYFFPPNKTFLKSNYKICFFVWRKCVMVSASGRGFCGWFLLGARHFSLSAGSLPHYEVRMSSLHDLLLRADVLLLSCIHNVAFLENLHCKGFGFFTFQLDLRERQKGLSVKKPIEVIG